MIRTHYVTGTYEGDARLKFCIMQNTDSNPSSSYHYKDFSQGPRARTGDTSVHHTKVELIPKPQLEAVEGQSFVASAIAPARKTDLIGPDPTPQYVAVDGTYAPDVVMTPNSQNYVTGLAKSPWGGGWHTSNVFSFEKFAKNVYIVCHTKIPLVYRNHSWGLRNDAYAFYYIYTPVRVKSTSTWSFRVITYQHKINVHKYPYNSAAEFHDKVSKPYMTDAMRHAKTELLNKNQLDDINSDFAVEDYTGQVLDLAYEDAQFQDTQLDDLAISCLKENPDDLKLVFGELAKEAIENIQYVSINSIAYLRDLHATFGEIHAAWDIIKAPTNPKNWASFLLACKYGTRLTVHDTIELYNGLIKAAKEEYRVHNHSFEKCRSMSRHDIDDPDTYNDEVIYHYKMLYRPYDSEILNFANKLSRWDLLPSSGNIWDLIPYTFVVDWFVDIGGIWETLDARLRYATLDIWGSTISSKRTYEMRDINYGGVLFDAKISQYHRSTPRFAPLPITSLSFPDKGKNNILTLAALIVQRK